MSVGRNWGNSANLQNKVSVTNAAEQFNVSPRAVMQAREVRETAVPELQEAVRADKVSLGAAEASHLASLPYPICIVCHAETGLNGRVYIIC
jgi:hypothetical protein